MYTKSAAPFFYGLLNVSQNKKKKRVFGRGATTQIGILNEWGEVEFGSNIDTIYGMDMKLDRKSNATLYISFGSCVLRS